MADRLLGGQEQWSSFGIPRYEFNVANEDPLILGRLIQPTPESDDIGHWVFYKTRPYASPGYKGKLTINIGEATGLETTGKGWDLAGNSLDNDPSLIEEPVAQNSLLNHFVTTEPDRSYSWGGAPNYDRLSPLLVEGILEGDYSVLIYLNSSLSTYQLLYNVPFHSGFWMWKREVGTNNIDFIVHDPEEVALSHSIPTTYPLTFSLKINP